MTLNIMTCCYWFIYIFMTVVERYIYFLINNKFYGLMTIFLYFYIRFFPLVINAFYRCNLIEALINWWFGDRFLGLIFLFNSWEHILPLFTYYRNHWLSRRQSFSQYLSTPLPRECSRAILLCRLFFSLITTCHVHFWQRRVLVELNALPSRYHICIALVH